MWNYSVKSLIVDFFFQHSSELSAGLFSHSPALMSIKPFCISVMTIVFQRLFSGVAIRFPGLIHAPHIALI